MSEKDVIVASSWIYDGEIFDILVEELRKPYPRSLRTYEDRVICVSDVAQGMVIHEATEAAKRAHKRSPDHGEFKLVVIPETGDTTTIEASRSGFLVNGDPVDPEPWPEEG